VEGVIEMARVAVEKIAVGDSETFANIDDVEPRSRRQFERDLDRGDCHLGSERLV
jgi:hypothetical protein